MTNWYLASINKFSNIKSLSNPITWLNCKFLSTLCNLYNKFLCKSYLVHFVILEWPLFLFQGYKWLALILINFLRNISSPWVIKFFFQPTSYSRFSSLFFWHTVIIKIDKNNYEAILDSSNEKNLFLFDFLQNINNFFNQIKQRFTIEEI